VSLYTNVKQIEDDYQKIIANGSDNSIQTIIGNVNKNPSKTTFSVWDIDDTLFKSEKTRIIVLNSKQEEITKINSAQYADDDFLERLSKQRNGGKPLRYNYGQFADSKLFYETAEVIEKNMAHAIDQSKKPNVFFIVLTARSNMNTDTLQLFLKKFEDSGLKNIANKNESHIIRSGNYNLLTNYKKARIMACLLKYCERITSVDYWDDSPTETSGMNSMQTNIKKLLGRDLLQIKITQV
jgi:hypothetical protein